MDVKIGIHNINRIVILQRVNSTSNLVHHSFLLYWPSFENPAEKSFYLLMVGCAELDCSISILLDSIEAQSSFWAIVLVEKLAAFVWHQNRAYF